MRRHAAAAAALIALLTACSRADPSVRPQNERVAPDRDVTPASEPSPTPTVGAPVGLSLVDEDFSSGPGPFFTDAGDDFEVSVGDGFLQILIAGRGAGSPNILRERVDLPQPEDGLAFEASLEAQGVAEQGYGGFGLRCYAGEDYYLFFWDVVGREGRPPQLSIVRRIGDDFRVLASMARPAGVGGDRRARFRAECERGQDGLTQLGFVVDQRELLTARDRTGLRTRFDGVAVGGEWTGPVVPPTLSGDRARGLTFTIDDVVVHSL